MSSHIGKEFLEKGVSGFKVSASGKFIPWQVVTISIDGRIIDK